MKTYFQWLWEWRHDGPRLTQLARREELRDLIRRLRRDRRKQAV